MPCSGSGRRGRAYFPFRARRAFRLPRARGRPAPRTCTGSERGAVRPLAAPAGYALRGRAPAHRAVLFASFRAVRLDNGRCRSCRRAGRSRIPSRIRLVTVDGFRRSAPAIPPAAAGCCSGKRSKGKTAKRFVWPGDARHCRRLPGHPPVGRRRRGRRRSRVCGSIWLWKRYGPTQAPSGNNWRRCCRERARVDGCRPRRGTAAVSSWPGRHGRRRRFSMKSAIGRRGWTPSTRPRRSWTTETARVDGTSAHAYALTELVGRELSVFRQAVRTYRPGPEGAAPSEHPLALGMRIADWPGGAAGFEDFLVAGCLRGAVDRQDRERLLPSFIGQVLERFSLSKTAILMHNVVITETRHRLSGRCGLAGESRRRGGAVAAAWRIINGCGRERASEN